MIFAPTWLPKLSQIRAKLVVKPVQVGACFEELFFEWRSAYFIDFLTLHNIADIAKP